MSMCMSMIKRVSLVLLLLVETFCFRNIKQFTIYPKTSHEIHKMSRYLWNRGDTILVEKWKNEKYTSRRMDIRRCFSSVAKGDCGSLQSRDDDEHMNKAFPIVVRGYGGFPSVPSHWHNMINSSTSPQTALILSDKRSRLRDIFDLELKLASGIRELDWGLWISCSLIRHDELARLASTRAQIKILAGFCFYRITIDRFFSWNNGPPCPSSLCLRAGPCTTRADLIARIKDIHVSAHINVSARPLQRTNHAAVAPVAERLEPRDLGAALRAAGSLRASGSSPPCPPSSAIPPSPPPPPPSLLPCPPSFPSLSPSSPPPCPPTVLLLRPRPPSYPSRPLLLPARPSPPRHAQPARPSRRRRADAPAGGSARRQAGYQGGGGGCRGGGGRRE
jgi:hypothetical protein